MSPENIQASGPEPSGMGELSRLTGVFFEPSKTFADIAERPTWIVPMGLAIVASLILMVLFTQHVGVDRMIRQQLESSPRTAQMSPGQREQAVQMGARIAGVSMYLGPIVGTPLYDLIAAAVLMGIVAGILSAPVKFKQAFAVVCWAGLPGVISAGLAMIVMFLKKPDDFDIRDPLVFNLGVLMDPQTSSKSLHSIATSLDLFSIWMILLLATGFKAAAGKRISFGGALFAVVLPWGVWVLIRAGLAGAGMMG
jgi:hypothetical protein